MGRPGELEAGRRAHLSPIGPSAVVLRHERAHAPPPPRGAPPRPPPFLQAIPLRRREVRPKGGDRAGRSPAAKLRARVRRAPTRSPEDCPPAGEACRVVP